MGFCSFTVLNASRELTGWRMEWRLPARKQGIFTDGWRRFDSEGIDRRQRSAEALNRTGEEGEDGVGWADHEVCGTRGGFGAEELDDDQAAKLTDRATVRIVNRGGGIFRIDWDKRYGGGEQSAAPNQFLFADAIGEEAEVADADKPEGSTWSRKRRMNSTASRVIVLVREWSAWSFQSKLTLPFSKDAQPVVGDRHTVRVARQILEHAAGSTEGRLDVNDPFKLRGCFTQGVERGRLSQIAKLGGEVKPTFAKSPSQREQK